tara:strand:+ start:377 stop:562 length:186 start_codon:yes stop_codon:yes gene_type:complete
MKRYQLICRRENGYASARVEEEETGAFVKYEEAQKCIEELEGEVYELKLQKAMPRLEEYRG